MRAVDRTTKLFIESLQKTGAPLKISLDKSRTSHGRSNYVFIRHADRFWKVRISDHPIGMNRALSGREDLYITAGSRPATWAVWIGELLKQFSQQKAGA